MQKLTDQTTVAAERAAERRVRALLKADSTGAALVEDVIDKVSWVRARRRGLDPEIFKQRVAVLFCERCGGTDWLTGRWIGILEDCFHQAESGND